MKSKNIAQNRRQPTSFWQIVSMCLCLILMSIGFAFGQTANQKLQLIFDNTKAEATSIVEISPDGNSVIIGGKEYLMLWDFTTGKEKWRISMPDVFSVKFAPDSKFLVAATVNNLIVLDAETGQKTKSFIGFSDKIIDIAISPDGKTIVTVQINGTTRVWETDSGRLVKLFPKVREVTAVAFSPEGKYVLTGHEDGLVRLWNLKNDDNLEHTFRGHQGAINSIAFSNIPSPLDKNKDFAYTILTGGRDKTARLFDVKSQREIIRIVHDTEVTAIASLSDDKAANNLNRIVIGDNIGTIRLWNLPPIEPTATLPRTVNLSQSADGVRTINKHEGEIKSINLSSTGKFIFSYGLDSTTRIWNIEQPGLTKEICRIIAFNNGDWAVISPEGRFDSAHTGELENLFWKYGNEKILLSELKEMYYEPNLLAKLLGYSSEKLRLIVKLDEIKLHPEIVEQKFDATTRKLTVKLKNRGGGIGETRVLVNDSVAVADARDNKLKTNPNIAPDAKVTLTVDLPKESFLEGGKNKISVVTSNYLPEIGKGNIQSRGSDPIYLDTGAEEKDLPTIHAIVAGVSNYEGEQIDLRFAAKDAEDFANALRLGANRLFCPDQKSECLGKVNIITLSTNRQKPEEQPTKENLKKAFAEVAKKAKPEDIVIVYLSGHGVTLGTNTDTYFYLTKEARSSSKISLESNFQTAAVSNAELTDWLTPNQGKPDDIWIKAQKRVLILDTCAAGSFAKEDEWNKDKDLSGDQIRAMEFLKDRTGTFILMGSAANRPSYETNFFNQGLLTYTLLQGFKSSGLDEGGRIDVQKLLAHAEKTVPDLAKEILIEQRPMLKRPAGNTFPIGQMTKTETDQIKLPLRKPLLLRPLLNNRETDDDDKDLITALKKIFDAESSYELMQRSGKGKPVLVYLDQDNYQGGIKLVGNYTVEGEKITLRARLRRDGKTIVELGEITANNKDELLEKLQSIIRAEIAKLK